MKPLLKRMTLLPNTFIRCFQWVVLHLFEGIYLHLRYILHQHFIAISHEYICNSQNIKFNKVLLLNQIQVLLSISSHQRCSVRKGVLRRPATLLKKRLWHRRFPVNFAKFPRTPFWQNTLRRLLQPFAHLSLYFCTQFSISDTRRSSFSFCWSYWRHPCYM